MSKSPTRRTRRAAFAVVASGAVVAGTALAGAAAASADTGFSFDRIAGANRYGTAATVADTFSSTNTTAILANGTQGNYADALSANYLAGAKKAPILLTRENKTPDETLQQLQQQGTTDIIVVGGPNAISDAQVAALQGAGYNVTRVAGTDRFETDAAVIDAGGASDDLGVVATGTNFPDALGGGPMEYDGHALGLSSQSTIKDVVINALKAAGVTHVVVLGGPNAVGQAVIDKLETNGITVDKRLAGTDRAGTSVAVANYEVANLGFNTTGVNVASGYTMGYGADALSGGPLTGKQNRPLLITNNVNNPGTSVLSYLKDNANTLSDGAIFGGPNAVSAAAQAAMEAAAQSVQSNQTYTVAGGAATANANDVLTYTVTGITDATHVDIVLPTADQVTQNSANGVVTFKGTNPGGSGNVATLAASDASVTVVNGAAGGSTDQVAVTGGTVTFSVKAGTEDFRPVVFADDADNDTLSLNADGTPSESFGVGQETDIVAPEAATGAITPGGTVTSVNKGADFFETDAPATYYYDSNDVFQVKSGSATTYSTVTMAQFEDALSVDDTLGGLFYNDTPSGQSTFQLNDVAPSAPTGVTAAENTTKGGVDVTFDDSATDTVASYNVYRATATQPTITGGPITCTTDTTKYSKVGSVDDTNPAGGSYTFNDTSAPATPTTGTDPEYCYTVTSVDEGGEESAPSATAGPVKSGAATTTGAPAFASAAGATVPASTEDITVTYNEDVNNSSVDADGSDFTVQYFDAGGTGHAGTVNSATDGTAAGTADTVTINVTFAVTPASGGHYIVTAKQGTDGDTVTAGSGTSQKSQAVGDQVFASQP